MKQRRPIRQILSWQLLLVTIIPLLLVGLLMGAILVPKILQEVDNYRRNLTNTLVTQIKTYLQEPVTTLRALSTIVHERQKPSEINRILDAHAASNPIFEAISLVSPEGRVMAVGLPAHRQDFRENHLGIDVSRRPFFAEVRNQAGLAWSETFLSTISGRVSVALAIPAGKNLLIGEINLHQLKEFMNHLHDREAHSVIIGHSGEIVASTDGTLSLHGTDDRELRQTVAREGNGSTHRFRVAGKDMIGSIDTLPNPSWKVLVYEPVASAYRKIFEMATILLSVAAAALLTVFVFSLLLARRVAVRFEHFARQAQSIAEANYERFPSESNIIEVNDFSESLRRMATAIQDRERALTANERKYRDLVEGTQDLIVLCDSDCNILYANHASMRILGMEPEACLGRSGFEFVHPDDRDALRHSVESWLADNPPPSVLLENRIVSASGEMHYMMWSISIHSLEGQVELLGIGRDTTEQKLHQAREQRLVNLQRTLSEINDAILRLEQEYALFPLVCRIAVEYGGMMMSWIGTLDDSGKLAVPAASYGAPAGYLDALRISIREDEESGHGPISTAIRERRHMISNDLGLDEAMAPWRDHVIRYGVRAGAFFPIMRGGHPYALFSVNSDQAGAFDDEIVQLLKEIAANVGFALDNFDREAARKEAEAALRASEERFRTIAEAAPFPMQLHTEDGEILLINNAWRETTGYTLADIPTTAEWTRLACGDYAGQAMANIRSLFSSSRRVSDEYLIRCKDGSQLVCYFTSSPIGKLPDGRQAMISMAVDITERRLAEKALQLTHFSINQASDPLLWVTQEGGIHFVNDSACRVLGYAEEELLGISIFDLNPTKTAEIWSEIWRELKARKSTRHETTLRTRSGDLILVEITSNFVSFEGQEYNCAFVRDITEKKKTEELVWHQANFDTLTGLPNRSMFMNRLKHEIRKSDRSGLPCALLFLDLDHFKNVNDTLGHATGDLLLQEAARRLLNCVRETDTVARLGGDEFTIILGELHDTRSIERIAASIQQRMAEPFYLNEETVYVSTSIGVTLYPSDATEIEDLLINADQAMYAAKNEGRKRHHYFTPSMQAAALSRMNLIKDLRTALDGDQFEVVYQPIVELATGEVRKAEALIRWLHPTKGLISPTEFIPAAEETGLIHEIGDWIFWQAADQATEWRENLHPQFQISVNMSPVQFRENEKSRAAWLQYLQSLEIPWLSLSVEITEGLLLDASTNINEQLMTFHDAGLEVAIDDFGTGYSSLSYLKKFDIDYLKIDRSFVNNLGHDAHDLALCEAIIVMAHKLGITVIAEGVETEEQRRLLAEAGCDFAQGYLFSRPIPARQFGEMYEGEFVRFRQMATTARTDG